MAYGISRNLFRCRAVTVLQFRRHLYVGHIKRSDLSLRKIDNRIFPKKLPENLSFFSNIYISRLTLLRNNVIIVISLVIAQYYQNDQSLRSLRNYKLFFFIDLLIMQVLFIYLYL